jgi:hypothetical protein
MLSKLLAVDRALNFETDQLSWVHELLEFAICFGIGSWFYCVAELKSEVSVCWLVVMFSLNAEQG